MKKLCPAAVLVPILLTALIGCGSSKTTSDGADVTTDTAVDVSTVDGSTAITEPATAPGVTTNSAGNAPSATNPPPTNPPATTPVGQKPKINDFSVSAATPCSPEVPDFVYPDVTVTWDISGATSVYVAIDNESGPYQSDLPAAGSLMVPAPTCTDTQTYYVVAENASGRTVKQEIRTAG